MAKSNLAQVVITANATTAKRVLDELRSKAAQAKQQMQSLADAGQQNSQAFKRAQKEFEAYNGAVARNISNTKRVDEAMRNLAGTTTRELKRALGAAKKEMENMAGNNPKLQQMRKNIAAIKAQIDKNNGSLRTHNSLWKNAAKNITAYIGVFGAFNFVRGKLQEVFSENFKFSDQLNDIRKVSGLTIQQVDKLAESLAKLDTRTSIQELSDIAYQGSKLGMGKYGVKGLEDFVQAANQVNVALKEDMGPEALTALSKMTETMGLIPKFGVEKSMLKIGSALFKLSSTTTSTSTNIVEFAKRLTGMARITGITTDQLLALGSASDSLAQPPEVAATAFGKLFAAIQKNHNLIEKGFGIEKGTINNLFSTGRAMDAIVLILEKMREKGNINAMSTMFKILGSDGQRLIGTMVTMAKNVDVLKEHLNTAKVAFREGTAASIEYAQQQESAQGILQRANNMWTKTFVSPEGIGMVKKLAQAWYDFTLALTSNTVVTGALSSTFSMLVEMAKVLLYLMPTLISYFLFKGVATAVLSVVDTFSAMKTAVMNSALAHRFLATTETAEAAAATEATVATTGLNTAMKANIFGAIAAIIATVVVYLVEFTKKTNSATSSVTELRNSVNGAVTSFVTEKRKLDDLYGALTRANNGTRARKELIKQFNSSYGSYLSNMITEKSKAEDLAKAYKQVVYQLRQKAILEGVAKYRKEHYDKYVGYEVNWLKSYDDFAKELKLKTTGKVLRQIVEKALDQKKNGETIAMELADRIGLERNIAKDLLDHRGEAQSVRLKNGGYHTFYGQYGGYGGGRPAQFLKMVQYLYQAASNRNRGNDVTRYANMVGADIDAVVGSTGPQDDTPDNNGSLTKEAIDKDALKAQKEAARKAAIEARAAAAAQKAADQYDLKDAKDEVEAIIDKVKNFYDRQITEIYKVATDTHMNDTLRDQLVLGVKTRMNSALAEARKSIADVKNTWSSFKKTMENDVIEKPGPDGYSESNTLLSQIEKVNVEALNGRINRLSAKLKRPGSSVFDEVWHNASKNTLENAKEENKVDELRRKKILEDNYTGKVNDEYYNTFEQLGFSPLEDKHIHAALQSEDAAMEVISSRAKSVSMLFDTARENYEKLLSIDINSSEGRKDLLETLFGTEDNRSAIVLDLGVLVDNLEKAATTSGEATEDIKLFYDTLIKYNDDYSEAQKKASTRQNKILDYRWLLSDQYKETQTAIDQDKDYMTPAYDESKGNRAFVPEFRYSPETKLAQDERKKEQAYLNFLIAKRAAKELLQKQEEIIDEKQRVVTKNMIALLKKRMDAIYELCEPIEQFGTDLGEAFVSSDKTIKEAVGSMINSFLKLTVSMTQNWIKQRLMQQIHNKLMEREALRSAKKRAKIEGEASDSNSKKSSPWFNPSKYWKQLLKKEALKLKAEKKAAKKTEKERAKEEKRRSKSSGSVDVARAKAKRERKVETDIANEKVKDLKKVEAKTKRIEQAAANDSVALVKETGEAKKVLTAGVEGEVLSAKTDIATQTTQVEQSTAQQSVQTTAGETQAKTSMGIASGAANIIGKLGWWGIPLVAVITALLNGLLSAAMGKVSSLFGKGGSNDNKTNTKLVSGMLTYDSGNVQSFRGIEDGKTYPVVGNDGRVYAASDAGELSTGLIRDPVTSIINGQPALIAERGPEMIIGRETTAAMMMARPDLLADIVKFDRSRSGMTYRAYDSGNVASFDGSAASLSKMDLNTLRDTISELSRTLSNLQQRGIPAHINKWGRGGISDGAASGKDFMSRYSDDKKWLK